MLGQKSDAHAIAAAGMATPALKNVLAAFSPRGDQFAITTGDGRVKIWSVSDSRIAGQFTEIASKSSALGNGHLSLDYSALCWGAISKAGSKKKTSLVVLASRSGDVVAWDPTLGEVKWKLSNCNPGGANSACFAKDEGALYVSGVDGMVCELDTSSGQLVQKFRASKTSVTAIAASADGTKLVAASGEIKLFNLSTKKRTRKFTGHATSVDVLSFTRDGRFVLSAAVGDSHVAVWDCEGSETGAAVVLSMEHPAVAVDSRGQLGEDGTLLILAISEVGEAYVWSGKSIKELKKSPPVRIKVNSKKRSKQHVISARFLNSEAIVLGRGTTAKPTFETFSLEGESGVVLIEPVNDGALIPSHNDGTQQAASNEVTVLGADNAADATTMKCVETGTSNKKKRRANLEAGEGQDKADAAPKVSKPVDVLLQDNSEKTMEERLKELGIIAPDPGEAKPLEDVAMIPKADALDVLLTQALQSGDHELLDQCLQVSNEQVIVKTTRQLKAPDAAKLLRASVSKLEGRTRVALQLTPWIRAVMLEHAASIMADKSLQPVLTTLYQMIEARLQMFTPLLSLSGRLDLIMAQIKTNEELVKNMGDAEAAVVYEEEDSEQEVEDAMEDEDYEDEDEDEAEAPEAMDAMQEDAPQQNGGCIAEDEDDASDSSDEDED